MENWYSFFLFTPGYGNVEGTFYFRFALSVQPPKILLVILPHAHPEAWLWKNTLAAHIIQAQKLY